LEGSGSSELMRAIYGVMPFVTGDMIYGGEKFNKYTPEVASSKGIAYLTCEREAEGVIRGCSIAHNIIGSQYKKVTNKIGVVDRKRVSRLVRNMKDLVSIKMTSEEMPIDSLSGGNKQKVLFARMVNTTPKLFLLDHATQGIDVEATQEVLRITREVLSKNAAILMSSESIEDMMKICDRIIVMFSGQIVSEFTREEFREELIFLLMQGFKEEKNEQSH